MSQHKMKTITADGTPCEVLIGWDRPYDGYFLLIERTDLPPTCPDDQLYLFDNLRHRPPHPKTLDPFLAVLATHGIALPPLLLQQLAADCEQRVMNVLTHWTPQGDIIEPTDA